MAGYTKADFDADYEFYPERYFDGVLGDQAPVKVHYHRAMMSPVLAARWAKLQPILNILSTDFVCVAGSAFGWGVEALIAESGATCVGVDVSDYVAAEKDNPETAELRAEIAAVGLDPDTGRGAALLAALDNGLPRSNIIVLQSDMSSQNERQLIRQALGGNWPNVVILEDLIDETTTDTEITQANNVAGGFGGPQRRIWITDGQAGRTLAQLQALVGVEVISTDGSIYLGGP